MHRIAGRLGIEIPDARWPALVQAATFESMKRTPETLVPTAGILKSDAAFFRRGTSGAGREVLDAEELAIYQARVAGLGPPGLLAWLDRG